jgi:hypothetical protein
MVTRFCSAATAVAALVVLLSTVVTDAAPRIPSSERPGRERERFLDQPQPGVPRIELRDGRPKPLFETQREHRLKRRKCRIRGAKRC